MNSKIISTVSVLALASFPFAVLAGTPENLGSIGGFFTGVLDFINGILIPLVIGLALLVFIYGLYKFFILGGGDEGSRAEGRQLMLYSILAFFLMVTVFAIVALLAGGLGLDDTDSLQDGNFPGVDVRDGGSAGVTNGGGIAPGSVSGLDGAL